MVSSAFLVKMRFTELLEQTSIAIGHSRPMMRDKTSSLTTDMANTRGLSDCAWTGGRAVVHRRDQTSVVDGWDNGLDAMAFAASAFGVDDRRLTSRPGLIAVVRKRFGLRLV